MHNLRIAMLIPAFNEERTIRACIYSCLRAGLKRPDIYVINDGSTDSTAELVKGLGVAVLSVHNGGKALAIEQACEFFNLRHSYDWIGVLDADSRLDPDYIEHMRDAIKIKPKISQSHL